MGSHTGIHCLACDCDYDCTVVRRYQGEGKMKMVGLLLVVGTNLGLAFWLAEPIISENTLGA